MSESSSSSDPPHKKLGVEPRSLPERQEGQGTPFEQLNEGSPEDDSAESERGIVQPRSLPKKDEAMILAAARLLQEGKSHEEVARQLKIEPLKLRRWEAAYSREFQQDLNEGDYHDTDAQLRELSDDSKEKFQGNWEQVTEKETERRVKVGATRAKLMANPITRWIFLNKHGALDYGTLTGIVVVAFGVAVAVHYTSQARDSSGVEEDDFGMLVGLDEVTAIEHDTKAAAQLVIDFHRTEKWEDKLAYVSHPEIVRPLMEAWYRKHPEDVYFDRIKFGMDQPVEVGRRNFIQIGLLVGEKGGSEIEDRPMIMAVERLDEGNYKIDWETSSGYQPYSFEELTTEKPVDPVELRLTLETSDFYNFGFNQEEHFAFKGTFLSNPDALYVYGRREDPAARRLSHSLSILESIGVIVKVRYPPNASAKDQLELVEVVSESWFRDYEQ